MSPKGSKVQVQVQGQQGLKTIVWRSGELDELNASPVSPKGSAKAAGAGAGSTGTQDNPAIKRTQRDVRLEVESHVASTAW